MGYVPAAVALCTLSLVSSSAWTRSSDAAANNDACSFSLHVRPKGDELMLRELDELRSKCESLEYKSEISAQRLRIAMDERFYHVWNTTEGLGKTLLQQLLQLNDVRSNAKDTNRNLDRLADELSAVKKKLKSLNASTVGEEKKFKKETSAEKMKAMQEHYNGIMGEVFYLREREELHTVADESHQVLLSSLQAQVNNISKAIAELERSVKIKPDQTTSTGQALPRDCSDHLAMGHHTAGVYDVYLSPLEHATQVYCHMTGSTAWTVLQRRTDGSVSFNRGWADYEFGFGNLYGEFWFGNAYINLLTLQKDYRLRIDAEDWEGVHGWAEYNSFRIGDRSSKYHLRIGSYFDGTLGDALSAHNNTPFSARDDGNEMPTIESAYYRSGWWHAERGLTNLNGHYYDGSQSEKALTDGIIWTTWHKSSYNSLKRATIKIAPVI